MCIPNFPSLSQLTNHNNKSKENQFQNNTRLMLISITLSQTTVFKMSVCGNVKNERIFRLCPNYTHTKSSINVRKTTLQPLKANLRQEQNSMVSLLYSNHRRCNYGARSPYARLNITKSIAAKQMTNMRKTKSPFRK